MMQILTHGGYFHADDVLAIAIVKAVLPEIEWKRTRDQDLIDVGLRSPGILVLDVGGEFDPEMFNFDHHQNDFEKERDCGTPYSTAGLIWEHYGPEYINWQVGPSMALLEFVHKWVDREFIRHVDAADNGGIILSGEFVDEEVDESPTFSSIISSFNPFSPYEKFDSDGMIDVAVNLAGAVLARETQRAIAAEQTSLLIQRSARVNYGKALLLDQACDWTPHHRQLHNDILFVILPSSSGGWKVQQVNNSPYSRVARRALPAAWAGLRNEELAAVTGVDGSVFCHKDRWMAIGKTQEDAIALVSAAIAE